MLVNWAPPSGSKCCKGDELPRNRPSSASLPIAYVKSSSSIFGQLNHAHKRWLTLYIVVSLLSVCRSAMLMSEILYYLCQLDSVHRSPSSTVSHGVESSGVSRQRVSVLVFVIRQWARSVGVTSVLSGQGFTNFMLTVLVVFFLQTRRLPLLPPLCSLKSTASGPRYFLVVFSIWLSTELGY